MAAKLSLVWVLVTLVALPASRGAKELMVNPDFESGVTHWRHDGFSMQTDSRHVHSGLVSVKCTGRTKKYMGPGQDVKINPGGPYIYNSYIRLINENPAKMYQEAVVKIAFSYKDGHKRYFTVAFRPYLSASEGWVPVGADFIVPADGWTNARLYLEGLDPNIDYYYDDTTLTEVADDTNWEAEANQRIENLRKGSIHFSFDVDDKFDKSKLQVQIDHTRHLFGWGSMVRADNMVEPDFSTYQTVVYHMFNWATVEAYKWRYNRGNRTHPDYSVAVAATDALIKHNLKVRGHCMFWAVDGHSPDWVKTLDKTGVRNAVDQHISYMTGITKGKIDQWDVNNELVHGHFFEAHTGDEAFTQHMFQKVGQSDPKPKLCLNDYNVVSSGQATQAYLSQILQFKAANVGLAMVGVQSHLKDLTEPDVTLLKKRLDILAQTALPIWITELDLSSRDENTKADWYEKVFRLYFSHPAIEGVTLWGFWDHDIDPLKALVHGYSYVLDEAGKRFLHLTKEEWSTHVNRSLAAGTDFSIKGFLGDYDVIVWYQGKPILKRSFHLGGSKRSTVSISVKGDGDAIQLPVKADPFTVPPSEPQSSKYHQHTVGHASSTSQSASLQCVTRRSATSQAGDDKFADITCLPDEVLTGCSSILTNNDWKRDGEMMIMSNGKPTCRAIDGFRSTIGIQAVARCCKLKGLSCIYRSAGPSTSGMDDRVVTPCYGNKMALGCSTWTFAVESDGTIFNRTSCASQNDGLDTGVYSYAACCAGGNLKCDVVTSPASGQRVGDKAHAQCPPGSVMTGCNVFSTNGRAAGAYISSSNGLDTCHAVNGFEKYGSEEGVRAMATCCHT